MSDELTNRIEFFKNGNYYVRVLLKEKYLANDTIDGEIISFKKDENNLSNSFLTIREVARISDNFPKNESEFTTTVYAMKSIDELKFTDWGVNSYPSDGAIL